MNNEGEERFAIPHPRDHLRHVALSFDDIGEIGNLALDAVNDLPDLENVHSFCCVIGSFIRGLNRGQMDCMNGESSSICDRVTVLLNDALVSFSFLRKTDLSSITAPTRCGGNWRAS